MEMKSELAIWAIVHPFYSNPLNFINELNYAFPALAPVLRALNKMSIDENWGKIILILHWNICCDPSSERLVKMVKMRGHNICFMQN